MSPQLAAVATMLLVAVFVLTNTVSADGSISGMYRASLQLAQQSANGQGVSGTDISNGVKKFFVGGTDGNGTEGTPQAPNSNGQNIPDNKPRNNGQKNDGGQKPDNTPKGTNPSKH